jgi:Secretion system C-terminal sorting domain
MKKNLFFALTILLTLQISAQVRYVTSTGAGDLSGSSWANAGNDLQTIINASAAGEQVWIAAGVYKPNRIEHDFGTIVAPARNVAFKLKNGVQLYGGFAGNETLLTQRNWTANKTIFSGDIDNNDIVAAGITTAVIGTNATHVIISSGMNSGTTVDGFFITGGYTANGFNLTVNGTLINSNYGSGITNYVSSPVIANCSFVGNEGDGFGGGIANDNSSPAITNCIFLNNLVAKSGTGILNNVSSPAITNCTFTNNIAGTYGAGIYNGASSPIITNCTFTNGTANSFGGAIFNTSFPCSPVISKCTFTGNSAYYGGAVYNFSTASATFKNCAFTNNSSSNDGGAIYNNTGGAALIVMNSLFLNNHASATGAGGGLYSANSASNSGVFNCTFYGNTAFDGPSINSTGQPLKVYNSVVWGAATGGSYDFKNTVAEGFAGGTNGNLNGTVITALQLFTNAATGNVTLKTGSPAIDAASNSLYTAAGGNLVTDKDLLDNARLVGVAVDMGSYEFDASLLPLQFGIVTARQNNDNALITWQTYDEINTSYFEIECSKDGSAFEKIAVVNSSNTTGTRIYNYTHLSPTGNILYYRIKQVDIDSRFSYSVIAKVNMNKNIQLIVYPNPASDIIIVKNINPVTDDLVQVISEDGKLLLLQKAITNTQLNIKNLNAGVYILRLLKKDKSIQSFSFIKQ